MPIGHAFIELGSVDSTNNYAMAGVHAGSASHGTIFFAHEQWAGKGQRGRTWVSKPGENIVMSVVMEPAGLPVARQFELSAAVALACHDLFSRYATAGELAIKWPNDLYWRDRKAGGILIENSFRGEEWLFAIAGMGINLNQTEFPETLRNPVSLRQITGRTFDAVEMARELGGDLEKRFVQLREEIVGGPTRKSGHPGKIVRGEDQGGYEGHEREESGDGFSIMEQYNTRLYRRNEKVRLRIAGVLNEVIVRGVSPAGELVCEDPTGSGSPGAGSPAGQPKERSLIFGEVEWLLGENGGGRD